MLVAQRNRLPSGRPGPGEFADYAASDIAAVEGDDARTALVRVAFETARLFEFLRDLLEKGVTYAPGKWTLKEVLAHLVDDERIFAYRALCLARGETQELPGFDEKGYAAASGAEHRTLESLLDEYVAVRTATLALFDHLPREAWTRRGRVNGYGASARGLAFHIVGHELHHHRVIEERYVPLK